VRLQNSNRLAISGRVARRGVGRLLRICSDCRSYKYADQNCATGSRATRDSRGARVLEANAEPAKAMKLLLDRFYLRGRLPLPVARSLQRAPLSRAQKIDSALAE
jgi:hypothetical protein